MKCHVPIAADGRLATHGIHDATIQAFTFVADTRFDICLRDEGGADRWFYLVGVPHINLETLINGTIVCDFFCWRFDPAPMASTFVEDAWEVLLAGMYRDHEMPTAIRGFIARYPNSSLVLITSSYGGTIAAICSELLMDEPCPAEAK